MIFAAPAVDINTGNARLLRLADFLENDVPADRFDFAHWVGKDWAGAPDLSCGTSACALGWATTIPEFQALGLKLSGPKDAALVTYEPYASSPSYAAQLFFGIPYTAVQILFHPDDTKSDRLHDYATADDVAAAIRRYVAGRAREAAVGKQAVPSPETVNVTD